MQSKNNNNRLITMATVPHGIAVSAMIFGFGKSQLHRRNLNPQLIDPHPPICFAARVWRVT